MKITKLGHSCLLVEMPEPVNRTALFDPGTWSKVDVESLEFLDDIFVTHVHPDHMDVDLIIHLVQKFPKVHVLAPPEAAEKLVAAGVTQAGSVPPEGVRLFQAPHESVEPLGEAAQEHGIHYLETLSHPGDSHHFAETAPILALPVVGPWGTTWNALKLALELKPKYVIPIHDWFWHDAARDWHYGVFEQVLKEQGITFIKPVNGEPLVLDV